MTLGELINSCELRSGFNPSSFRPTWRSFINEAARDFARKNPWPALEDELTAQALGRFVILPHFVDSIVEILNLTDLNEVERGGQWGNQYPATFGQNSTGRALAYDHLGEVPTVTNPTGFVWFSSAHASDIYPIYITGLIHNSAASGTALENTYATATANAAGVSPVTVSTRFASIISLSKATNTNGAYRFYDAGASGGAFNLSFIPAEEQNAAFKRIQLRYVPNAQTALRIRFRRKPHPLTTDDQAFPPGIRDDYLVHSAIAHFQREQAQYQQAQLHDAKALDVLQAESNKANNFEEPFSQFLPSVPGWMDPEDDRFGGWS